MQNSDKILHQKFVQLGNQRHRLTKEICALLPDIYKKEIYKKEGYATIYEYAGKIAGLSKFVVEKVLRIEKHLEGKIYLKQAIKTQGIHKVGLVAKLATPETDKFFAGIVENSSKEALLEFAREVREKQGLCDTREDKTKSLCHAVQSKINIELDEEMRFLFLKLKKKLGENLSNKEAMRRILLKLTDQECQQNKNMQTSQQAFQKVKNFPGKKIANLEKDDEINKQENTVSENQPSKSAGRYIPAEKKRELLKRNNGKCEYPNCSNPAEIFHHSDRFAVSKSHDSVSGMCKVHHEFAHNGLIQNEKDGFEKWQLNVEENNTNNQLADRIDILYKRYRQEALIYSGSIA